MTAGRKVRAMDLDILRLKYFLILKMRALALFCLMEKSLA